ncbi:MAG: divalent-cation tolerance protein CutA [Terriglobia bacterium]
MKAQDKLVVALSTFPEKRRAEQIARTLVSERLAACVWVFPKMRSFYQWKEKTVGENEHLMVLKTRFSLVHSLEKRLHELHPYSVPEFVVIPTSHVSRKYFEWAMSVTGGKGR